MMNYYKIEKAYILGNGKHTYILGSAFDGNIEPIELDEGGFGEGGRSLKDILVLPISLIADEKQSLYSQTKDLIISFSGLGGIFLYNTNLKNEIERICPNDIEFYQVHVKGRQIDSDDYYAMNILHRLDCADLERSEYTKRYSFFEFTKLVIDRSKIPPEVKIFTVDRTLDSFLFIVNDEIRNIFLERDVPEVDFTLIEVVEN